MQIKKSLDEHQLNTFLSHDCTLANADQLPALLMWSPTLALPLSLPYQPRPQR